MPQAPPTLAAACLLAAASSLPAAISVSGVSDESSYTGSVSFTVADPAGFTTTATLNGNPVSVGTSVSVASARFYELVVTETPDGGGAPITETVLFNVRRDRSETGLPAFRAVPLVNDASSAIDTGQLVVTAPAAFPNDLPIPVIARLQRIDGEPLWLNALVQASNFPDHPIQLRRGFGYGFLPAQSAGTTIYDATTAGLVANVGVAVESGTVWTTMSGTLAPNTGWGIDGRIHIDGDLTVPPGGTLSIGPGTVVKIDPDTDIHVEGTVTINGSLAAPVVFTEATPGSPWGGFLLQQPTSTVNGAGAIFTGSGADENWFPDTPGFGAHRDEQALFTLGPAGASLALDDCFLIENDGQLLHIDDGGDITLTRCLLQGVQTCGELSGDTGVTPAVGSVAIDRCALLLFPSDDPSFADGDNDAIYLTSGTHLVTNTVIAYSQDDGIDTGGSPDEDSETTTTVRNCWFESLLHEAIACSGGKTVTAEDTVFLNCGQAVEAGYDSPQVFMRRCLSTANLTGARMGDSYDWDYTNTRLTVEDCLLIHNLYHDIWGYDWSSWTYNTAKMDVTGSYISSPDDLARHPGSTAWDPQRHAPMIAPFMPVPGSNVGVAVTGVPRQGPLGDFDPVFDVQLSTFSSRLVEVDYVLWGLVGGEATTTRIFSGTVTFSPGETQKSLLMAVPPPHAFELLRLSLGNPTNAEVTGGEAWFFDAPSGDATLIPRGSSWRTRADRAEPAAGWKGRGFDDGSWSVKTTQIGFGDGDEHADGLLDATEAGPDGDRTRAIYFRHTFQLDDPSSVSALRMRILRDDGAVVYLNGVEVDRTNMPSGTVTYDTFASSSTTGGAEDAFNALTIPTGLRDVLVAGANVIAVEVHQRDLDSSDLSFDFELEAAFAPKPGLSLSQFDDAAFLHWLHPEGRLETSNDLSTWEAMPLAPSPHLLEGEAGQRFYRVRYPQ